MKKRIDPDNPPVSERLMKKLRPAREVVPDVVRAAKRIGRPPVSGVAKEAIKLRIDADVIERYRATGPGWQTKMNEALRRGAPRARRKVG